MKKVLADHVMVTLKILAVEERLEMIVVDRGKLSGSNHNSTMRKGKLRLAGKL